MSALEEMRSKAARVSTDSAEQPAIAAEYVSQADRDFGTELTFRLTNLTGREISALKGGIHLYDQFDDHLEGLGVKIDVAIAPGESIEESGMWLLVSPRTLRLLAETPSRVRVEFQADQVHFSDEQPSDASVTPHAPERADHSNVAEDAVRVEYVSQREGDFGTTLTFRLVNMTGKEISALKGGIHIYDQFGDHLDGLGVKIDTPIGAGQSVEEEGMWPAVGARTLRLLAETPSRLKLEFRAEQIHFSDGTVVRGR